MKKKSNIICTVLSVIITFLLAELFSLYHFGDIPTLLTLFYLISIFIIFEYFSLTLIYIINKLIKKERIKGKEILGRILLFVSLLLILLFAIILEIDWLNWYAYSTPFYINVIIKAFKYLLSAILILIIEIKLIRKNS